MQNRIIPSAIEIQIGTKPYTLATLIRNEDPLRASWDFVHMVRDRFWGMPQEKANHGVDV